MCLIIPGLTARDSIDDFSFRGTSFFALNYPTPGVDNRKKEPPGGGSFLRLSTPGVVSKGGGRRPRRPKKRHPVGVPFCYSSSEGAKLSLAVRPEIIKHKKDTPRRKAIFTIPPALAGGIYLSPAAAGDIYFVRAVRRGLIKRKKRKAQWAFLFFEFN